MNQDYTETLRSLMQRCHIPSFRALAQQAQVSDWQIRQLRQGKLGQMRLDILQRISLTLQISLVELLSQFDPMPPSAPPPPLADHDHSPVLNALERQLAALQREYERSQTQLTQQQQTLQHQFQRTSLETLESWLLYWPAAVFAATQNSEFPATRLIPLVKPMEQLLMQWKVEAIAPVGTTVPYDPQYHQLIKGNANPGDSVRIRNPGYTHAGVLLHRAKVEGV
ncbi:MAG: helix-turn-helix transcriptional regulator [Leptolyngbyaceae bacterium]|nr:helix-turn-helix transcriptional regulator [Leptolyngbyaceae bacterium]